MLHLMIAAGLLWTASAAVCAWGDARYWRHLALTARRFLRHYRAYNGELMERCYQLERTAIRIVGPDHLGKTATICVTIEQWRLIEDFLAREASIQLRPLTVERF